MAVRHFILLTLACLVLAGPARAAIDWTYVRPGTEPTMGDWFLDVLGIEGFGKSYAVIVGVNEFRHFDRLDATAGDPDRVFRFFRDELRFDRILVLRNSEVTYGRLRTLFEHELPRVVRPEDSFLFYWSGHGTQFKNARGVELGYLPLVGSPRDNKASMVSMRDLSRWDGELPARHALFLLDACFSGLAGDVVQSHTRDLKLRDLARPGHHIISAGGKDEQTIASRQEWQGSIFTHALLKALRGDADRFGGSGGGDDVITLHELVESIANTVEQAKAKAGWNRPLRPVLNKFHGEGQYFFLTNYRVGPTARHSATDGGTRPRDLQPQGISPTLQERDLELSREERRLIQGGLKALGHEAGVSDGIMGSKTREAIRSYQVALNAEPTGFLTADQAKSLISKGKEVQVGARTQPSAGLGERKSPSAVDVATRGWPDTPQESIETIAPIAFVVNATDGVGLLAKNADDRMHPASLAKLMTTYLVFEALKEGLISLGDKFSVSEKAWRKGGSKMFVEVGKQVRIEDLLRGVIVQSGNDASIVLAEGLSGTEQAFAEEMTRKAFQLGMTNSRFTNATGWPEPDLVTTARDLAILAHRFVTEFPEYHAFFSEKEFTYNGIRQANRNPLLYRNVGADGLSTGHTEKTGYAIVASGAQSGKRVIVVLSGLKSIKERAREAERLLLWAYRSINLSSPSSSSNPRG